MATPKKKVNPPERLHPNSRVNRIAALAIGESDASATRLEFTKLSKTAVTEAAAALRNSLSKAADQAAKRSGNKYSTEGGQFFTGSGDIIVSVVITRMS